MKEPILKKYDAEGSPYYASARYVIIVGGGVGLARYINMSVVTCQRYVCQNVIPLTLTVLINHCVTNI